MWIRMEELGVKGGCGLNSMVLVEMNVGREMENIMRGEGMRRCERKGGFGRGGGRRVGVKEWNLYGGDRNLKEYCE
jgi:hypothetical protein